MNKDALIRKLYTRNLTSTKTPEEEKRILDGLKTVSEFQVVESTNYLIDTVLPMIKKRHGEDSEQYRRFNNMVDNNVWCMNVRQYHNALVAEIMHLRWLNEIYVERCNSMQDTLLRLGFSLEQIISKEGADKFLQTLIKNPERFKEKLDD